jgi:alkanesulfonate monooxygenase SsuD/methylene tetrahydromethanopterin reductase-like flavin-dependent oxidoreductase (luciferase family)
MKVYVFDLLPYGANLEHLQVGRELPYPLPKKHFDPQVAARTYEEHLQAWEELDRLGFDGVGFNEHHTSPYGLMNSPNLLAAAAAQRTKRLRLLVYGNLLPLHNPVRLAEELSMLDCMSNGRMVSGMARGIPREYGVFGVPMSDSRARFEEAWEIIKRAWTEEVFSYEGRFWKFQDVAIWPRPMQQPHPPVWIPILGSKETIEWAAKHDLPITPGIGSPGLREDIIRYYARCLEENGRELTPEHLILSVNAYVGDSKAAAVKEVTPYVLYFNHVLFSHGNSGEPAVQRQSGYLSNTSYDYIRPENLADVNPIRENIRGMTAADVEQMAESAPFGSPAEVRDRLIELANSSGAGTLLVSLNRGAMPQDMFLNQIRRFGTEVLPALQADEVKVRVP